MELVCRWYTANLGKEGTPQAFSGSTFEKKFRAIIAAMERANDRPVNEEETQEVISSSVMRLGQHISRQFTFPPQIVDSLTMLVVRTDRRWKDFLDRISRSDFEKREDLFRAWIILHHAHSFVTEWFGMIHDRYGHLEKYSGPIMFLAFRMDHTLFRLQFWHSWSYEYSGRTQTFDPLLDRIIRGQ
jgi:hypothetical protein